MGNAPKFKDDLPTDPSTGAALRGEQGDVEVELVDPAPGIPVPSTPESAPRQADGPALPAQDLSPEESAAVAKVLFTPTIRRMGILLDALMSQSGNGDFGLWAPLAVLDAAVTSLQITPQTRAGATKFLALVEQTLHTYANRMGGYRIALQATAAEGTVPPPPAWEQTDTLAMYDAVEETPNV